MVYDSFLNLVRENADTFTKDLIAEIRTRNETRHYQKIPDQMLYEQISQVIRNVSERMVSWLKKNKPKNTLFAYYSRVGAQRCKEGVPLDEVVIVLMLIKRRIWHFVDANKLYTGYDLHELMELNYYITLFFDRIIHSTILGYHKQLGRIITENDPADDTLDRLFARHR